MQCTMQLHVSGCFSGMNGVCFFLPTRIEWIRPYTKSNASHRVGTTVYEKQCAASSGYDRIRLVTRRRERRRQRRRRERHFCFRERAEFVTFGFRRKNPIRLPEKGVSPCLRTEKCITKDYKVVTNIAISCIKTISIA